MSKYSCSSSDPFECFFSQLFYYLLIAPLQLLFSLIGYGWIY